MQPKPIMFVIRFLPLTEDTPGPRRCLGRKRREGIRDSRTVTSRHHPKGAFWRSRHCMGVPEQKSISKSSLAVTNHPAVDLIMASAQYQLNLSNRIGKNCSAGNTESFRVKTSDRSTGASDARGSEVGGGEICSDSMDPEKRNRRTDGIYGTLSPRRGSGSINPSTGLSISP